MRLCAVRDSFSVSAAAAATLSATHPGPCLRCTSDTVLRAHLCCAGEAVLAVPEDVPFSLKKSVIVKSKMVSTCTRTAPAPAPHPHLYRT